MIQIWTWSLLEHYKNDQQTLDMENGHSMKIYIGGIRCYGDGTKVIWKQIVFKIKSM